MARPFKNPMPDSEVPRGAPKEIILREFAKRLQNAMLEKGWNQSELARAAARHMDSGNFGRDNISNYVRALVLPGPAHLSALAKALGKRPEELMPARSYPSVEDNHPPLDVKDLGTGRAWLRVNQAVDWDTALKVLNIMKDAK